MKASKITVNPATQQMYFISLAGLTSLDVGIDYVIIIYSTTMLAPAL